MPLLILNENPTEPVDYEERKTAKGVIVDDNGNTAILSSYLIGGGVENGESYEEALHREAMEEAGMKIEIIKPLGEVIGYRDALKRKYLAKGYLCKYLEIVSAPTTNDTEERGQILIWKKPHEAIARFESEIDYLKTEDKSLYKGDEYQSKLFNRQMSLAFLKEAFKN